jgi:hypothetical protein
MTFYFSSTVNNYNYASFSLFPGERNVVFPYLGYLLFFCFNLEHAMAHCSQPVARRFAFGNYAKSPCMRSYNSSLFVRP